jgi:hypothetical protein
MADRGLTGREPFRATRYVLEQFHGRETSQVLAMGLTATAALAVGMVVVLNFRSARTRLIDLWDPWYRRIWGLTGPILAVFVWLMAVGLICVGVLIVVGLIFGAP